MIRYVDRRAESLERVMRFISDRNWSSVGVAMVFFVVVGDGLEVCVVGSVGACGWSRLDSKVACGLGEMWWSVHNITNRQGNTDQQCQ
jgi:hypothetical protein